MTGLVYKDEKERSPGCASAPFIYAPKNAGAATLHPRQPVKEPRRVSPPERRKKVKSFSPATCAAEKIPLGLQTCAPSVQGGRRVRCSQAANPAVKKGNFFDSNKRGCRMFCTRAGYAVLASAEDQIFMQTSHARQMTVRRLPMATQSPTRCTLTTLLRQPEPARSRWR